MARLHAKCLRKSMTDAELRLWYFLRAHRFQSFKFKRKTVIGNFIVDFVCFDRRLIIEVDGEVYRTSGQTKYDLGPTFTLTELGYRELRFTNQQVLNRLDEVLVKIP